MFFLGIPIIILIIFTESNDKIGILLTHMTNFKRGKTALTQIRFVLDMIDKKDNDRNAKILLKGYIFQYETNCINFDCPLKKYISSLNNNSEAFVFLLQHVELMYQNAIAQFPQNIQLRISFASFLFERMNKKQQASFELKNSEKYSPKFEEQFIIYRYNRILVEQVADFGDIDVNVDTVSNIEYQNHFTLFQNAIGKVTNLYIDFWSLLLKPNKDSQEDLAKLNNYGSQINVFVEGISNHFEKMQKLKHNDSDVIRFYSDFLNDILNDKDKALLYKNVLNQLEEPKKTIEENNVFLNIESLNTNEEYQYIIVSALPDKFGLIINISLGVCTIFGYTKSELIGKMIEVIMPEIYHKGHREMLLNKVNDYKKLCIDIIDLKNYQPEYKAISTYGKNKSRYLIPINIKTALIPNEENDIMFVCKLWQTPINATMAYQACFILTNTFLNIQNFTANAVNLLGMNSNAINSIVDITEFIKQFNEEFLKYAIDSEEKTFEQKLILKRTILSKKYKNPTMISWKKSDEMFDTKIRPRLEINTSHTSCEDNNNYNHFDSLTKYQPKLTKVFSEELFVLTVQEVTVRNIQEGYLFKFDTQFSKKMDLSSSSLIRSPIKFGPNERINSSQNLKREYKFEEAYNRLKGSVTKLPFDQLEELSVTNSLVDKSFVPYSNLNFQFDPSSLTYKPYENSPIDCKEYLKGEAIKKLKPAETIKSSDESSDFNSSQYSSSRYQTGSISLKNHNDEGSKDNSPKQKKETIVNKNKEDYYKVNVSMIKYSQYDFGKGTVVEIKDYDKTDQVQFKLVDENKGKEALSIPQAESKEKKAKINNAQESINEMIEDQETGNSIMKQIEYALSKEETQPSIRRLRWICLVVFVLLMSCGGGLLGLILNSFIIIKENVNVIEKAYDLFLLNDYGTYYIREITLLNNDNYTAIPRSNRTEYIDLCFQHSFSVFILAHQLIGDILTSFLPLSLNNSFLLKNSTMTTTIIEGDYSVSQFDLLLRSAFIETNTALLTIVNSHIDKAFPTNKDIFYYLYNSLNQMTRGYSIQAEIYFNQYNSQCFDIMISLICVFVGIVIVIVVILVIITIGYQGVIKRKESYLEVFFEIGNSIINTSLDKCENFTKRLHVDSVQDMGSSSYDDEIEEDSVISGSEIKKEHHLHKKFNKTSKETRSFKVKTICLLSLVVLFSLLVSLFYLFSLDEIRNYMVFYINKTEIEGQYLSLFNTLREYMFDPTSKVMSSPSEEHLGYSLQEFYRIIQRKQNVIDSIIRKIPDDYYTYHTKVHLSSVCDNNINENCNLFMSNLSGFGLEVVLSYFVEEIRFMKRFTSKHIEQQKQNPKLIYNLTLAHTELGKSYWPPIGSKDCQTYEENDQINIFNQHNHHLKLNFMLSTLILPNFQALSTKLKKSIENSLQATLLIYIITLSIYLGIITFGYVFLWLPFSQKLNQTIYKTKNMLSIIPKEVLASLTNINRLLDIGQNLVNPNSRGNHKEYIKNNIPYLNS